MSELAEQIARRGADIIVDKAIQGGQTIIFKGTAATLRPLNIGDRQAWQTLIDDNDPKDGTMIYIRLTIRSSGAGDVKVMTPANVARHLSNVP